MRCFYMICGIKYATEPTVHLNFIESSCFNYRCISQRTFSSLRPRPTVACWPQSSHPLQIYGNRMTKAHAVYARACVMSHRWRFFLAMLFTEYGVRWGGVRSVFSQCRHHALILVSETTWPVIIIFIHHRHRQVLDEDHRVHISRSLYFQLKMVSTFELGLVIVMLSYYRGLLYANTAAHSNILLG